jgi:ribosomal protein S27E
MGWREKRWYDNLRRLEHYIIKKYDIAKLGIYVDVEEVMKLLGCSRATAYNYLIAVAQRLEKRGAVLKKLSGKLYLFLSETDYEEFIKKTNDNIMTTTPTTIDSKGIKVKCTKCGYEWITRSKRIYVTCSSCKASIKVVQNAEYNNK